MQKTFSLGQGATLLNISKATLRKALLDGKLEATTNSRGHYVIPLQELLQYQQDLPAPVVDVQRTSADQGAAQVQIEALKGAHREVVQTLKDALSRAEKEADDWKAESQRWHETSDSNQKLLTDQRPVQPEAEKEPEHKSRVGRYWLLALALLCLVGAVAGYNYLDIPVTW